jgi:hypothetical protein
MRVYDKYYTATAVSLYKPAILYTDLPYNSDTRTDLYHRIKILDKAAFDFTTISIKLYKKTLLSDKKVNNISI